MNQPWSTFPNTLTTQPGAMAAPQAMLTQKDGGASHPVGTGPFTFVELDAQLARWWSRRTPTTGARASPTSTASPSRSRPTRPPAPAPCRPGEDDAIEQGDPGQIKTLASQAQAGKLQFFTDSGLYQSESFQAFNTAVAPFNDPLARQIVAYATDRVNLDKAAFQGVFTPGHRSVRAG